MGGDISRVVISSGSNHNCLACRPRGEDFPIESGHFGDIGFIYGKRSGHIFLRKRIGIVNKSKCSWSVFWLCILLLMRTTNATDVVTPNSVARGWSFSGESEKSKFIDKTRIWKYQHHTPLQQLGLTATRFASSNLGKDSAVVWAYPIQKVGDSSKIYSSLLDGDLAIGVRHGPCFGLMALDAAKKLGYVEVDSDKQNVSAIEDSVDILIGYKGRKEELAKVIRQDTSDSTDVPNAVFEKDKAIHISSWSLGKSDGAYQDIYNESGEVDISGFSGECP